MSARLRVLITGAGGQIGQALCRTCPEEFEVRAFRHAELDITDTARLHECLADLNPDLIINAAAYSAVDRAESEPDVARRVNGEAPRLLAEAVRGSIGCRLLHISTDFVFDGRSSSPYPPEATPNPLSAYGRSKLAGERAVLEICQERAAVLRTAWVYAAQGNNFLRTMLRLMRDRGEVRVVADQVGTPTSAQSVAGAIWALAHRPGLSGLFHWTDAGVASWYDFAVAIAEEAGARNLLGQHIWVMPIGTAEYPTPAQRPAYSVLDKRSTLAALELTAQHWRVGLRTVIGELAGG